MVGNSLVVSGAQLELLQNEINTAFDLDRKRLSALEEKIEALTLLVTGEESDVSAESLTIGDQSVTVSTPVSSEDTTKEQDELAIPADDDVVPDTTPESEKVPVNPAWEGSTAQAIEVDQESPSDEASSDSEETEQVFEVA